MLLIEGISLHTILSAYPHYGDWTHTTIKLLRPFRLFNPMYHLLLFHDWFDLFLKIVSILPTYLLNLYCCVIILTVVVLTKCVQFTVPTVWFLNCCFCSHITMVFLSLKPWKCKKFVHLARARWWPFGINSHVEREGEGSTESCVYVVGSSL